MSNIKQYIYIILFILSIGLVNAVQLSSCQSLGNYNNTLLNVTFTTMSSGTNCFTFPSTNVTWTNVEFTCENRTVNATGTVNKAFFQLSGSNLIYLFDNVTFRDCNLENFYRGIDLTANLQVNNSLNIENIKYNRYLNTTSTTPRVVDILIIPSSTNSLNLTSNITIKNINCSKTSQDTFSVMCVEYSSPQTLPLNINTIDIQNIYSYGGRLSIIVPIFSNTTINNVTIINNPRTVTSLTLTATRITYPQTLIVSNINIINSTYLPLTYSGEICMVNVTNNIDTLDYNQFNSTTFSSVSNIGSTTFRTQVLKYCSYNNIGWMTLNDNTYENLYPNITHTGYYNTTNGRNYDFTTNNTLLSYPYNQLISGSGCIPNWIKTQTDCGLGYQYTDYIDVNNCNSTDYLPTNNGTYNYCPYTTTNINRCGIINQSGYYTLTTNINQSLNIFNNEYYINGYPYCILINSSNVYLNLNNNYITDNDNKVGGIAFINTYTTLNNITLSNGKIIGINHNINKLSNINDDIGIIFSAQNSLMENITFIGNYRGIINFVSAVNTNYNSILRNINITSVQATFSSPITINNIRNLILENIYITNSIITNSISTNNVDKILLKNIQKYNNTQSGVALQFGGNITILNSRLDRDSSASATVFGNNGIIYLINTSIFKEYIDFTTNPIYTFGSTANFDNNSMSNTGWLLIPNRTIGNTSLTQLMAYYNESQGGYNRTGTYHSDWNYYLNNQIYNCSENWIRNDTVCDNLTNTSVINYYDANNCNYNRPIELPFNNGTIYTCGLIVCIENWILNNTPCINGYSTIQFYDNNMCNTTYNLPVINGTTFVCDQNYLNGLVVDNTIKGTTNMFIAILVSGIVIALASTLLGYLGLLEKDLMIKIITFSLIGMTLLLLIIAFNMFNAI